MTKHGTTIALIFALAGCHGPIPEGRYPCTTASDCPATWSCHVVDQRCWSQPETTDAGTDAFVPSDAHAPVDAPMIDTGPTCSTEICNGSDDDCDGLIDEGVITVGPAVTATTSDFDGALIIGQPAGWGIVAPTLGMPSAPTWLLVDAAGAPVGGTIGLGSDASTDYPTPIDLVEDERQVLITDVDLTADTRFVFGFDPSSGARRTGSSRFAVPLPSGRSPTARAAFGAHGAGRVTLYVGHHPTSGTGDDAIRRIRLDVSGDTPVVLSAVDIATDVSASNGWAIMSTALADYVVYFRSDRRVVLSAGPSDDSTTAFHIVGPLAPSTSPQLDYAAIAIRDPSAPVSASNPLGVAWEGRNDSGTPKSATFVEVTNTTVFAATLPATFADSLGGYGGFFTTHPVALFAFPDANEHWLLVNQDYAAGPPSGGALQVREIIGPGSTVRRIDVPGEMVAGRTDIGLASSGSAIRIVERANGTGLVTRSIACE